MFLKNAFSNLLERTVRVLILFVIELLATCQIEKIIAVYSKERERFTNVFTIIYGIAKFPYCKFWLECINGMLSIWKIVKDNLKHVLIGEQRKEMVEHTAIFIEFELCFYMNFKKKNHQS